MTKIPKDTEELKSDTDSKSVVSVNNRKVSKLKMITNLCEFLLICYFIEICRAITKVRNQFWRKNEEIELIRVWMN